MRNYKDKRFFFLAPKSNTRAALGCVCDDALRDSWDNGKRYLSSKQCMYNVCDCFIFLSLLSFFFLVFTSLASNEEKEKKYEHFQFLLCYLQQRGQKEGRGRVLCEWEDEPLESYFRRKTYVVVSLSFDFTWCQSFWVDVEFLFSSLLLHVNIIEKEIIFWINNVAWGIIKARNVYNTTTTTTTQYYISVCLFPQLIYLRLGKVNTNTEPVGKLQTFDKSVIIGVFIFFLGE